MGHSSSHEDLGSRPTAGSRVSSAIWITMELEDHVHSTDTIITGEGEGKDVYIEGA
jgi:glycerate kinase